MKINKNIDNLIIIATGQNLAADELKSDLEELANIEKLDNDDIRKRLEVLNIKIQELKERYG